MGGSGVIIGTTIERLEALGFVFELSKGYPNERASYAFQGSEKPDAAAVRPLLEHMKANRAATVAFLRERKARIAWLEVFEQWEQDPNPANDSVHVQRLVAAAVIGRLPFYEDGQHDSGPDGWRRWAKQFGSMTDEEEEVMPMRAFTPRPLPWE